MLRKQRSFPHGPIHQQILSHLLSRMSLTPLLTSPGPSSPTWPFAAASSLISLLLSRPLQSILHPAAKASLSNLSQSTSDCRSRPTSLQRPRAPLTAAHSLLTSVTLSPFCARLAPPAPASAFPETHWDAPASTSVASSARDILPGCPHSSLPNPAG